MPRQPLLPRRIHAPPNTPMFPCDATQASRKNGKKNSNGTFKEQENEALVKAWTDPGLKKHLLLDLILYDHAVSVHRRQMAHYGLDE